MMRAMRVAGFLLIVFVLAGLGGGVAQAAAPAKAVVATGKGGFSLAAYDEKGDLCLELTRVGENSEGCGDAPDGTQVVSRRGTQGRGPEVLGVAVPASATQVEVRRAGRLLGRVATVAGEAYRGKRAGALRFALVTLPATAPSDGLRVRALDARGTLIVALDLAFRDADLITGRRVLLAGGSGRTRWSIAGEQHSTLEPSIIDLENEKVRHCLDVRTGDEPEWSSLLTECTPPDDVEQLLSGGAMVAHDDVCGARFRLVHGAAPTKLAAARVTLGDGRVLRARTAEFDQDGRGVYAVAVPAGAAVRSVQLVPATGPARVLPSGLPPLTVSCASGDASASGLGGLFADPEASVLALFDQLPAVTPTGPVTEVPGPPAFRVADGPDGGLCVAVAGRPFTQTGCGVVSPGYGNDETVAAVDSFAAPHVFVVPLPAEVASVRLTAKGGTPREVRTVAADGYAGAYAGHVRFFAARLRSLAELRRTEYLSADGRVLHSEIDDSVDEIAPAPRASPPVRVAGAPGRPSLWQTSIRGSFLSKETLRCLALTPGAAPRAGKRCQTARTGSVSALVAVPCATHRLTVAVAASGGRVALDTGRGAPRVLQPRHGAVLLTLPPNRGLRSITVARQGHPSQRIALRAPAGAAQCGWTTSAEPRVTGRTQTVTSGFIG